MSNRKFNERIASDQVERIVEIDSEIERLEGIFQDLTPPVARLLRQPHCDCEGGHMRLVLLSKLGLCALCGYEPFFKVG